MLNGDAASKGPDVTGLIAKPRVAVLVSLVAVDELVEVGMVIKCLRSDYNFVPGYLA